MDLQESSALSRRGFLHTTASGILFVISSAAFAEELMKTPRLTEGPFYPDKMPLDRDNDLIIIGKSITPAIGEITRLSGRILEMTGSPIKNALVEIWQCDAHQVYLHSSDSVPKAAQRDKNFQGYGKFETDSKGRYFFRTIKPVPYPGRPAAHIHFKVSKGGKELLTTQLMVRGLAGNKSDDVYMSAGDSIDRELILADFRKKKDSKIGELSANFDIIVGRTPDESAFMPANYSHSHSHV